MLKNTTILSISVLLIACGGGSGNSDQENGNIENIETGLTIRDVNISLNNATDDYHAYRLSNDDNWLKIAKGEKTLTLNSGEMISFVTVCETNVEFESIRIDQDFDKNLKNCDEELEEINVTFTRETLNNSRNQR